MRAEEALGTDDGVARLSTSSFTNSARSNSVHRSPAKRKESSLALD